MEDVGIFYYPETGKGHDIGVIHFRGDMDKQIGSERVQVEVTYDTIFFKKDPEGKGLKLNRAKIQLWTLAYIAKTWEGQYPLKYDIESGCYCIHRDDVKPHEREYPSRLGDVHDYPDHKESTIKSITSKVLEAAEKSTTPTQDEPKTNICIVDNSNPGAFDKHPKTPYTKKKITEFYLKDKIIELLLAGRPEDSTVLANALKIVQKEDE